jgi:hypothetical protein
MYVRKVVETEGEKMVRIPKRVSRRIASNLRAYQAIVADLRGRDVSEADTVTAVKDILTDIFGYDKYVELTSELQIRGTYCDLAVRLNNKIAFLIEVKAAGVDLNETHLRQAVNYGAKQGIEWIILTNSLEWRFYRISFAKPIDHEEVAKFVLTEMSVKKEEDLGHLFLLCREGIDVNAIAIYHQQAQILNRFIIGQIVVSDPVVHVVRRELRKMFPELKVDADQVSDILVNEVVKREVVEGDKVRDAHQRIRRASAKLARRSEHKQKSPDSGSGNVPVARSTSPIKTSEGN